jgi:hypothetical protein
MVQKLLCICKSKYWSHDNMMWIFCPLITRAREIWKSWDSARSFGVWSLSGQKASIRVINNSFSLLLHPQWSPHILIFVSSFSDFHVFSEFITPGCLFCDLRMTLITIFVIREMKWAWLFLMKWNYRLHQRHSKNCTISVFNDSVINKGFHLIGKCQVTFSCWIMATTDWYRNLHVFVYS